MISSPHTYCVCSAVTSRFLLILNLYGMRERDTICVFTSIVTDLIFCSISTTLILVLEQSHCEQIKILYECVIKHDSNPRDRIYTGSTFNVFDVAVGMFRLLDFQVECLQGRDVT